MIARHRQVRVYGLLLAAWLLNPAPVRGDYGASVNGPALLLGEPPIGSSATIMRLPPTNMGMNDPTGCGPIPLDAGAVVEPMDCMVEEVPTGYFTRLRTSLGRCHLRPISPLCPRLYGGWEHLHWWSRGIAVPALITSSPTGTPQAEAGVLGLANTTSLVGPQRFPAEGELGRRYTLGLTFGEDRLSRLEYQYFNFGHFAAYRTFNAPADLDILARPYFNTFTGQQVALLVGYPGVADGQLSADVQTDFFGYGFWWKHGCCDPCGIGAVKQVDWILGYRSLDLNDWLTIDSRSTVTDPQGALPAGTIVQIRDQFSTENDFRGADFGIGWRIGWESIILLPTIKLALGSLHHQATIVGNTDVTALDGTITSDPVGLLALPSNAGVYESSQVVVVPEVNLTAAYQWSPRTRFRLGYTLIMVPHVLRAGGLVDTNVDSRQLPPTLQTGLTSPAPVFRRDDYWIQGIQCGMEFAF